MRKFWPIFILCLLPIFVQAQPNDLQNMANLASRYYQDREFAKAAELYGQLFEATKSEGYFSIYFECLLAIPDFDRAEKAVKKGLRSSSQSHYWNIQWGYLKRTMGQIDEAEKLYEKAISSAQANPSELANQFINRREFEYAEKVYIRARAGQNQPTYNYELARVYYYMRKYELMLGEYIEWIKQKEGNIDIVKSSLQSILSLDNDGEINLQLRNYLMGRIQRDPTQTLFNQLLIWLFTQDKNFAEATKLAIALDKRTGQEGALIFGLGNISASNKEYNEAEKAYTYLLSKGKDNELYMQIVEQLTHIAFDRFIAQSRHDEQEANKTKELFVKAFADLGKTAATSILQAKYAHLQAFYLNQSAEALKTLNDGLALPGLNARQISALKTELADVYVYSSDFGEAIISYSQVIENNRDNTLGDEAKFKKARLGYYMGDFAWAKAQLDVLKASTSKLIANDAMELSLFINENLEADSLAAPLKMFARAEYQIFKRNHQAAIATLDSVARLYPDHQIFDDMLFRKAEILQELGLDNEATALYEKVATDYSWSLLADDALFRLATVYMEKLDRKAEAMELFKKIITDYPGSVHVVNARVEYRKLQDAATGDSQRTK